MRGNPSGGLLVTSTGIKTYSEMYDESDYKKRSTQILQEQSLQMANKFRFVKID